MASIFQTKSDNPYDVEIAGVGVCRGNAIGGLPVERAAMTLGELQDKDGKPLSGAQLTSAAKKFADERDLQVGSISQDKLENLSEINKGVPRPMSVREVSEMFSARERAFVETDVGFNEPLRDTTAMPPAPTPEEIVEAAKTVTEPARTKGAKS